VPVLNPQIAYYVWRFPVLSQTFVRREVSALQSRGAALQVFAEAAEDVPMLDPSDRALLETTTYLLPVDRERLENYKREFRRSRFFAYCNVYLYIMSRRYGLTKKLVRDRNLFHYAVYLAGTFRDRGINRVHSAWGDRAGFAAMLAAKLLGVPFTLQVRAHDLHDPSYHETLRELLENAEFVITNTQYNRPYIEALMPEKRAAIHTIYNGVDLSTFNAPSRPPIPRTAPVKLLCVARLVEQKGLTHLLDACAMLRDRGFRFTCEVIGGVEEPLYAAYWERLKKRHRKLRLENHVFFRGARPFEDVMNAYRSADMFVLPCVVAKDGRRDITPNALIEAMAMRLPVISTTVTGVVEIVEADVSGLLVGPGDPVALAETIERVARDDALARRLAENARKRVEERFDAHRNVEERLRLFSVSSTPDTLPRMADVPALEASWQGS
jgi:glycosyltransferase involved in cell wall biosynthesis